VVTKRNVSKSIDAFQTGGGSAFWQGFREYSYDVGAQYLTESRGSVKLIHLCAYSTTSSERSSAVFLTRHTPTQRALASFDCINDVTRVAHLCICESVDVEKWIEDRVESTDGRYSAEIASEES
jgi:hypothetical protein